MNRRWITFALVLAVSSAGLTLPQSRAGAAADQNAVKDPVPLLELTNPQGIHFYTLSRAEADAAVSVHGFRLHPSRTGYARSAAFPGSQPLFRLALVGRAGWLVTPSVQERDQLAASGRFRYEGVLGHVSASPAPGTAVLSRFSNGIEWRLALEAPHGNANELLAAGYLRDGPVGHVHSHWIRAGALYFGTWDKETHPAILRAGRTFYGRDYDDWWAGVRDYSGGDPSVPLYRGAWPNDDFSDRQPAIGFYDDSQPATVEKHITQATSAGLDYFAFYWYWNPQKRAESHGVGLQSFLRARNRATMDFAVTICAHSWDNGVLKIPVEQYGEVTAHLVGSYLSQPNYLRANDGRRVVWLCDTNGIGSGSATDVRSFTDRLRAAARERLNEDILVLAHQDLGLSLGSVGADGDYCAAPYGPVIGRSYRSYVDGQRSGFANGSPTFVRCVMSDFDERPRYPTSIPDASKVRYFPDHSFDLFNTATRNAYADIAGSNRTSVVDNFVLVYAWNEWHEGGHIEPNARDGCRYLDLLRAGLRLTGGSGCVARPQ